jgi:signal peptidase
MIKQWNKPEKTYQKLSLILISLILADYLVTTPFGVSFFGKILTSPWFQPAFWLGIVILLYFWPWVKIHGKERYQGFLRMWAFNFAALYIIALILGGVFNGFGRSPYNHSALGILKNLLQVGIVLGGRELARSYITNSFMKRENYLGFVLVALLMALTDISLSRYLNLHDYKDAIQFAAQYLAPEFMMNLLAVYFVYKGGAVPALIYMGIIQAFQWLSPILPDLRWITAALIGILCPYFSYMYLQNLYAEESRDRSRIKKENENPFSLLITSLVSISIVWFSVGVFPVYPSVVATGSMEPLIMPGDVVLVDKVKQGENFKVGDIIQFRRDTILIDHRIIEIIKDDKSMGYRTKGDNNSGPDSQIVKPEDVRGKIIHVVPKLGWPTLLFKSDNSVNLKDVVF